MLCHLHGLFKIALVLVSNQSSKAPRWKSRSACLVNDGVLASNKFRLVQRERGLTGATPSKCLRLWTGQQRACECRVTVRSGWRDSELMASTEQFGSHCWTTCGPHARSPSSEEGLGAARPRWREHRKTKQSQATSRDRTRRAAIGHRSTPAHRNRYEPAQAGSFTFQPAQAGSCTVSS